MNADDDITHTYMMNYDLFLLYLSFQRKKNLKNGASGILHYFLNFRR